MATETNKLKLKKPADEDFYNVNDANNNMEILDVAISSHTENLDIHVTKEDKSSWAKKDLSNVSNGAFLQKASDCGILTDVIPLNKTRAKIHIEADDNDNEQPYDSITSIRASRGNEVVTVQADALPTDLILELDAGIWKVEILSISVPPSHYVPKSQTVDGKGGCELSLYFSIRKKIPVIWEVDIDNSDPNPETCVTYVQQYVPLAPANGNNGNFLGENWYNYFPFNEIYPCITDSGDRNGRLERNKFGEWDGSYTGPYPAPRICDDNVMIHIPKIYYGIKTEAGHTRVKISNIPQEDLCCNAFCYAGKEHDFLEVSAYLCSEKAGADGLPLRSVSGAEPLYGTAQILRERIHTTLPDGFEMLDFQTLILLQCLYIIVFKI